MKNRLHRGLAPGSQAFTEFERRRRLFACRAILDKHYDKDDSQDDGKDDGATLFTTKELTRGSLNR